MLATVVWLFNLAAGSYGKHVLWLGVFLVVVAFAAWIFGEFVQRGRNHKGVALRIVALILLVGGYAFALEKELDWRAPMPEADATGSLKESADGIDWQRWSPEAVAHGARRRQAGARGFHRRLVPDLPGEQKDQPSKFRPCARN